MPSPWTIILDFDGTITTRDADAVIADSVLGPNAPGFIEPLSADYEQLRLTTAQYFERYLERLQLTPDRFAAEAVRVPLRAGIADLVAWCAAESVDVHVASEGLDVYIEPILAAAGLGHLALSCNVAHPHTHGGGYRVDRAPDGESCDHCLTCKGALARRLKAAGQKVALVGNGASDLCGARHADLVFARDSLTAHCVRESIAHVDWSTFAEVQQRLTTRDSF